MIVDDSLTVAELRALGERYEIALMANDVATLDAMFWQSPQVVRFGVGEDLYGIAEVAAFRASRPGGSPQRQVLRTTITAFGTDFGVINVAFQRGPEGPHGRQSQTWIRFAEGWRIVSAHVSLRAGSH